MTDLFADSYLLQFTSADILWSCIVFMWAGFVRSGLGFGGAALGLPIMLFIYDQPLFWLPVIGFHLLFFSSLTLRTRIHNVDWTYIRTSSNYIIPAALVGVLGLLNLPNEWLLIFIYGITFLYGLMWLMNWAIHSSSKWIDRVLLILGGYIAGTSLTGAPLMVAVYMKNVPIKQLRDTLFVLWFTLVTIKMLTFAALDVRLHFESAVLLLPTAAIGHVLGLKTHEAIMKHDAMFKRVVGSVLMLICLLGLINISF